MRTARLPLIGLMLATVGLYASVWWHPQWLAAWGIRLAEGRWFVDTEVLLAASDAHALGQDQPLWYSDWWLRMHALGLGRTDTVWLGLGLAALFLVVAFLTLRPQTPGEAVFCWLVLCSPPVLLGVNRANMDLLIFAGLALAGWLLAHEARPLRWLAPLVISFLAGLKFYPIVAAAALPLARQSRRETRLMLGYMALLAVLLGLNLYDDVMRARGLISTPVRLFTFGAAQIIPPDSASLAFSLGVTLLGFALVLFWWRRAPEPPAGMDERAVVWFALGAITLVGCFFAGVSYNYRLVFGLLLLPLLGLLHRETSRGLLRSLTVTAGTGLLILLWLDGLVCLFLSLRLGWVPLATIIECRQLAYGLVSWVWIGAVLGLLVMLARPVCRRLWQPESK